MAAAHRVVEQFKAPASGPGPETGGPDSNTLVGQEDLNAAGITPPWHIRHARLLIAAAGVLLTVGLAYASYHIWQIQNDPVDRILAARGQPAARAGQDAVAPVAPAVPPPVMAAPAAAATPPSLQQPRSDAAPFSGMRPMVTHTQREEAGPGGVNPLPSAAIGTAAASSGSQPCSEGVVALGLCPMKTPK